MDDYQVAVDLKGYHQQNNLLNHQDVELIEIMFGGSQEHFEKGLEIPNPLEGFYIAQADEGDTNISYTWYIWAYLGNKDEDGKPFSEPLFLNWADLTIPKEEIESVLNNG